MLGSKKNTNSKDKTTSLLNSIVAGTTITGTLHSEMDIRIDGKLEGSLKCSAKVVVGTNALILGDVHCKTILIEGKVEGNIVAQDKLHIQSCGTVVGDLTSNILIIEDGAVFNGASVMGKSSLNKIDNAKQRNATTTKEVLQAS